MIRSAVRLPPMASKPCRSALEGWGKYSGNSGKKATGKINYTLMDSITAERPRSHKASFIGLKILKLSVLTIAFPLK